YRAMGGSITVNGQSLNETVTFRLETYAIEFVETGLSPGARWWVNLTDGASFSSNGTLLYLTGSNGTFAYTASAPGYNPATGNLTIRGSPTSDVAVTFEMIPSGSS